MWAMSHSSRVGLGNQWTPVKATFLPLYSNAEESGDSSYSFMALARNKNIFKGSGQKCRPQSTTELSL